MTVRYDDVYTYVKDGLAEKGYGGTGPKMPLFDPGPASVERLQQQSPHAMVFLTLGNGLGPTVEQLFDRPFIIVRVLGLQRNFDSAETLAYDIDKLLLEAGSNTQVGSAAALYITRTGGPPQLIDFDAGDRYHFQTTYLTETVR